MCAGKICVGCYFVVIFKIRLYLLCLLWISKDPLVFFYFDLLVHMMKGTLTPICYWADEMAHRHLISASVSCGNWGKLAVKWGMQSSSLCCGPSHRYSSWCHAGFLGPLQLGGELLSEVYSKVEPLRLTDRMSIEQSLPQAASWLLPSFFSLPSSLHRKLMLWKLLPLQFPLEPFPQ